MTELRYLTFEINPTCNLAAIHPRCPINDPDRYRFGSTSAVLTDELVLAFWRWARTQGFSGTVLWHLYNEPTLALDRIRGLMREIQAEEPTQAFHLWTNHRAALGFDAFQHVQLTDYAQVRPEDLDNRRASTEGEGRPYAAMRPTGRCTRSYGWEVILDHHGNWLLCCNDWRCEESVGNVHTERWDVLLERFRVRAEIAWHDEASYQQLPRLCRACMDVNPNLSRTAKVRA